MKVSKSLLIIALFLVLGLIIYFPGRALAREHVNYETAVQDHPLSCISCHYYTQRNGFISKLINEDYLSPFNLTVSKDGNRLYVIAQDTNELLVVDADKKNVLHKIKVGNHPHSVITNNDGRIAFVSNQWSDNVSVIDLVNSKVTTTLKTGNGPAGLALSADEKKLYVVNSFGSNLSVINLITKKETNRFTTGNNPTGIALSKFRKELYITSRRQNPVAYGEPLVSDITVVNDSTQKIKKYVSIKNAYLMENVVFTPSGDLALTTLTRPKNLVPAIQVERGWMMNDGIGIINQKGKVFQLLIDEPNSFYSSLFDVVISPNGKKAFLSSSAVDYISVVDLDSIRNILANTSPQMLKRLANNLGTSSRFVTQRIKTGACPKGLALSPNGKLLYVAEMLDDKIGIINTETLKKINTINLGGPKRITIARKGRRLFNNAGHTFQNQYACYTCHPDNHEDGLEYNFAAMGRNIVNVISLREIADTPPYKWSGTNQSIYKQDGMRFSKFLTRTEAFNYEDLDALVAYIKTGIKLPPNLMYNKDGKLTKSQLRGKNIFNRSVDNLGKVIPKKSRCVTCHLGPYYTNLKLEDVGTLSKTDDPILFDTPSLSNIYASAPYLHDGRAKTLEEIWTLYGGDDKHGRVNDLSKIELNDLVNYLKSLRGPEYEKSSSKTQHTSF
jgi:YVTN family beta-propeller protein